MTCRPARTTVEQDRSTDAIAWARDDLLITASHTHRRDCIRSTRLNFYLDLSNGHFKLVDATRPCRKHLLTSTRFSSSEQFIGSCEPSSGNRPCIYTRIVGERQLGQPNTTVGLIVELGVYVEVVEVSQKDSWRDYRLADTTIWDLP